MSETIPPARKLPKLEPGSAFFWTSGADGVLRIQRCSSCGTWQHPPFPRCSSCGSEAVAPAPVSGKGRIASYTINHERWLPGLQVPFVFAVVELAEQSELYVFTNLLAPVEAARLGMPVTVAFEQHEDVWLPMFRPDETGGVA
ncbi:Zn-ribbon domain-containing OB-fold protein [Novosphingobium mangrovi (ex Huang et al. 2023)]|uniref:OB-fold domain-containing protein n=1 Tax=Novosphingobium mangrovi (ex Huang et al. 2023) TaxID=2976432 RepID=A0ABT2I4Q3_9SPHN|nr:OB-fold domain-containing protein [Novosphingobium mangrovi (ex Huang et al. 2023)]MCT2399789.1 OB-fold domain-containing protein [Novosphingobium mangrovi (ex Huang et al. 2023)]